MSNQPNREDYDEFDIDSILSDFTRETETYAPVSQPVAQAPGHEVLREGNEEEPKGKNPSKAAGSRFEFEEDPKSVREKMPTSRDRRIDLDEDLDREDDSDAEDDWEEDDDDLPRMKKKRSVKSPKFLEKRKAGKAPKKEKQHRVPGERRSGKGKLVLVLILVLLLAAIAGVFYAAHRITNSDVTLPNVYAGDINLSNMTKEEASKTLNESGWETRTQTPLTVTTLRGVTFDVDPVESGAIQTADSIAEAAYHYGHDGSLLENLKTYLFNLTTKVDVNSEASVVNTEYVDNLISSALAQVNEQLSGDEYVVDEEASVLRFQKGWPGVSVDTAAFRNGIIDAIRSGVTELSYTEVTSEPQSPDFNAIHVELQREPQDAYFSDDGKFTITPEVVGCEFDVTNAQDIWNAAPVGSEVEIPITITYPEVTEESLSGSLYRDLLGTMTTDYSASVDERKNNVRLATSKINGLIMYPGDEFSYNTVVGPRTVEAGFMSAPAYSNGEVVEEIGGGACQVSSTLYSACLFAFMEITDRTNHYFRVNYMQLGTDATVTIPAEGNAVDFCFRNNRDYPIKIVGITNEAEDGTCTLTFEIWGTRQEGDYACVEFDNSNQYGWENQWTREVEVTDPGDYTLVKEKLVTDLYSSTDENQGGRSCTMTLTYRIVTDLNGNELLRECVNKLLPNGQYAMDTYYNHTS